MKHSLGSVLLLHLSFCYLPLSALLHWCLPFSHRWYLPLAGVWFVSFALLGGWYLPLFVRRQQVEVQGDLLILHRGVFFAKIDWVPLGAIQHIVCKRGPFMQKAGLVHLFVATGGRQIPLFYVDDATLSTLSKAVEGVAL